MRKAFVGVTDFEWYQLLARHEELIEVNFWQPSGDAPFRALSRGDLFLFKLHSPNNFIVGGGFFEASSLLPVSLAWDTFGLGNGVASLQQMRERIAKYRRDRTPVHDPTIGNIILQQPFYLDRMDWIPIPPDFSLNIVRGKTYDLDQGHGLDLWSALQARMTGPSMVSGHGASKATISRMFSDPVLARRRLGQGGFRVLVTDHYQRRCAITSEHTLPVLEAAHIRPVTEGGEHSVTNGLLLRSDVHTLFDRGYVTVTPDYVFRVSRRLDEDWQNGKIYYNQDSRPINLPSDANCYPDRELLEWHSETVFLR